MKLAYFSNSDLSTEAANAVHVVSQCESLGEISQLALFCVGDDDISASKLKSSYGATKTFKSKTFRLSSGRLRYHLYGFSCAVYALLKGYKFAYCRDIYSCFYGCLLGLNCIFEFHSVPNASSRLKSFILKTVLSSNRLIALTSITKALKNDLIKTYPFITCKVKVLPDAARKPSANLTQSFCSNNKEFNVGYVGNLYLGKGMELIVKLAPLCKSYTFHVVGGDRDQIEYWKNIANSENIKFHGKVSPSTVGQYMHLFDVVLAPNQAKVSARGGEDIGKWTSPLKLFEYMSYKKPIVCSNLPVLKEVMNDGKNCFLACATDELDWKNKLDLLKRNSRLCKTLGEQAYKDFCERYTWESRAKEIISLFK